ncbi:Uu.00g099750.m01.CDS01 [Anthostomella pinea]|uniref:Uu.00g099750.m01.CDS01 n=1 Tax=Anthostomella pinea TaxID=933095 RepID=A0AAI8VCX8_9PEZI|nr:Uu.00g099750.m01.CDS01 [Anthostomella pinea]
MSLHVTVYVAPANVDRFKVAFKPVFDRVAAEPECLFFELYTDAAEPGKLSWVENWSKSTQWFAEYQMTKDYYKDYLAVTEPMFVKPREYHILERAGPDFFMVKTDPFPQ